MRCVNGLQRFEWMSSKCLEVFLTGLWTIFCWCLPEMQLSHREMSWVYLWIRDFVETLYRCPCSYCHMADSMTDRDLMGILIFLVVQTQAKCVLWAEAAAWAAVATMNDSSPVPSNVCMPLKRLPSTFSRGSFILHWPLLNMIVKRSLSSCNIEGSDILQVDI